MEIQDIQIDDEAPEDLVQFIKHVQENLDPANETDYDVWMETIQRDSITEELPEDVIGLGADHNYTGDGVRVQVNYAGESPASGKLIDLAENFFGSDASVSGRTHDGTEEMFVFLVQN